MDTNDVPPTCWQLMELIDARPSREIRYSEIPPELLNALQILKHKKWLESDSVPHSGPVQALTLDSPELPALWDAYIASQNPAYWFSSEGRYKFAMHRECAFEPIKEQQSRAVIGGSRETTLDGLPDDAKMNHVELAKALGLKAEPLRQRLDRWRKHNGDGWHEVTERKARQPKYVYRVGAIRDVLREAMTDK